MGNYWASQVVISVSASVPSRCPHDGLNKPFNGTRENTAGQPNVFTSEVLYQLSYVGGATQYGQALLALSGTLALVLALVLARRAGLRLGGRS